MKSLAGSSLLLGWEMSHSSWAVWKPHSQILGVGYWESDHRYVIWTGETIARTCSFQALNIWSIMYVADYDSYDWSIMYVVDYDSYDGKLSVEKNLATKSTLMPKVSNHR